MGDVWEHEVDVVGLDQKYGEAVAGWEGTLQLLSSIRMMNDGETTMMKQL